MALPRRRPPLREVGHDPDYRFSLANERTFLAWIRTALALIPVAALLVVLLRTVVGLRTLGTFSPVLLSLGYTQSGLLVGLGLTVVLLVAGLVGVTHLAGPGVGSGWSTALPVVVTAVVVERLWEAGELDGWRRAGGEALQTLAVALGVTLLLFVPAVADIASEYPLPVAVAAVLAAAITGTYRGARLLDRWGRHNNPVAPGGDGDSDTGGAPKVGTDHVLASTGSAVPKRRTHRPSRVRTSSSGDQPRPR